ncbi:MAG TPA: hypothetical protein VLA98_08735 [Solirubrobacteraceae bacterium]|nr:hypothetical protein [Solirubrobacteraceae bacterium]
MSRRSKLAAWATDPATGWDPRLWRRWALYSALAYTVILAVVLLLTSAGLDITRVAVDHRFLGTLLIATTGALLYGTVLGALQWRVLRERLPIPRRRWVRACVIPAFVLWIAIVVPAAIEADAAREDLRVAYFLALSQALALGPVIGFAQASALRPYTPRWRWWIAANLVSWLIVNAVFYVVSLVIGGFDFAHGEGSPLEAYVLLILATPLSGRWLLWVTAPGDWTPTRGAPP